MKLTLDELQTTAVKGSLDELAALQQQIAALHTRWLNGHAEIAGKVERKFGVKLPAAPLAFDSLALAPDGTSTITLPDSPTAEPKATAAFPDEDGAPMLKIRPEAEREPAHAE